MKSEKITFPKQNPCMFRAATTLRGKLLGSKSRKDSTWEKLVTMASALGMAAAPCDPQGSPRAYILQQEPQLPRWGRTEGVCVTSITSAGRVGPWESMSLRMKRQNARSLKLNFLSGINERHIISQMCLNKNHFNCWYTVYSSLNTD